MGAEVRRDRQRREIRHNTRPCCTLIIVSMHKISDCLSFGDLQTVTGLQALDRAFSRELERQDPKLHAALKDYRSARETLSALQTSELLLALAPLVENFIASRFGIETELEALCENALAENHIAHFKKEFVQQRARRYRGHLSESFFELDAWLDAQLDTRDPELSRELAVARYAGKLLDEPERHEQEVERLTQWCVQVLRDPASEPASWTSFSLPQSVNFADLVPLQSSPDEHSEIQALRAHDDALRQRDGFKLTDTRMGLRDVQDHVNYCVYCHEQEGDFCSKGFPKKKKQPELGLKVNPLGVTLTGCPLEEKISEMHVLQRDGRTLAALVMAMVDNPMIPATGHRICNDCMKGCIYQKQDPVNIPQIETRILTDVLSLPYGVEIYDLLTRWNPLRRSQYIMAPYRGRKVLIVGMGPAGFTMAHHLTMAGCAVAGVDGLKIEPLPEPLLSAPVRDYESLCEALDERIMSGFGGVAEYGITVRWDKNFLKLIYLTLARRETFRVFGGVRLGGTLKVEDAWRLGFDHVCIANGAGLPRVINMGNSLARGMRQANDFLMALQLTGAAKADSLASLQIRMPAVVIGGGLTAIDTATEVQAYYIIQVEKLLTRYEVLAAEDRTQAWEEGLDEEARITLGEFLEHGRAVRAERERARAAGEEPDFIRLLRAWGGVTIVYRRSINESPAYLRNHEEIVKAMEEGLYYIEGLEPVRAELDRFDHVERLVCRHRQKKDGRWLATGRETHLPARAILVAAGTFPNTIYEEEFPGTFKTEHNHFLPHVTHSQDVQPVQVAEHCKANEFGPFTSYVNGPRRVSFIGDAHPVFHGSVVKAIASAARSHTEVLASLDALDQDSDASRSATDFLDALDDQITPRVSRVISNHPAVVELWVHAPLAARNYQPGQFFRMQTFETAGRRIDNTRLQIPLQTVSGAGTRGNDIRLFLLRYGAAARLAEHLKPGAPLVLMGPNGAPSPIHEGKTVLVIAGSWGAAVMLDLGPALLARGNRVLYFAFYGDRREVYYQDELETGADQVVWVTAKGTPIEARRPQDLSVTGHDTIELLLRYHRGELGAGDGTKIPLSEVDQIMVMGSTGLLKAFQSAMREDFENVFRTPIEVIGTVGSPMQCMMKGVCAQCLQWQIDPDSGERTRAVFSCAMQEQPLMWIDVDNLGARQRQNQLQEALTNLWVNRILEKDAG